MNETYVTIVGNIVDTPTPRVARNGAPFLTFRLASTVRRPAPDGNGFVDGNTSFVNVSAFRQLAHNAHRSLRRGQPIIIQGRLRVSSYLKGDGSNGTSVDVEALHIGHDLGLGASEFSKVRGPSMFVDDGDRLSDPAVVEASIAATEAGPVDLATGEVFDAEGDDTRALAPEDAELAERDREREFAGV